MKYNIIFKCERGAYQIKENPKFPTELLFNNTVECLYDWVGNVQQIIIDVIHEDAPDLDTDLSEYCRNGELSVRAVNGLRQVNVFTFRDLLKSPRTEVYKSSYIGKKTFAEIGSFLNNHGYRWEQLRTDEE